MIRPVLLLLAVAGALLGLAAEWVAFGWDDPRHWVPDLAVGWSYIACGLVGRWRRPNSGTGPLMVAVGFTWFLGNFASVDVPPIAWLATHALYLHRGPLIHCVLSYPTGRLTSGLDRGVVAIGYLAAAVTPIARNEVATAVLGALLIAVAVRSYAASIGPARRARLWRCSGDGRRDRALRERLGPIGIPDSCRQRSRASRLRGCVVRGRRGSPDWAASCELGAGDRHGSGGRAAQSPSATLRDALAGALGDPTLEVGFWLDESGRYVDAQGRPFEITPAGAGRAVTPIELDGRPLGVLVHDPAVLDDPGLVESIGSAARLAAANARLQAEVRAQVAEVMASRRRLVDVADEERRRLEHRLREGAGQRLDRLTDNLIKGRALAQRSVEAETQALLEQADRQLGRTIEELHELARGLHPRVLEESGLAGALTELVRRSPVPIELQMSAGELPAEIEAGVYFVCSEGLANVAKHSRATSGEITVAVQDGRFVVVEVVDDGVGGADERIGTGLHGLRHRVEALGGLLVVMSSDGGGPRLTAEIPLGGAT